MVTKVNKSKAAFQPLLREFSFLFALSQTYSTSMSVNHSKLNEILKISRNLRDQNLRILAVFDLDSTLFNVSYRTQKILHEYAEKFQKTDLKNIQIQPEDWGIKEALYRAGYSIENDHDFFIELRDFWRERFFSNDYIHYDIPYPGAIAYLIELAATGCEIKYLTGREQTKMAKGSEEVLKKWGFPLKPGQLILKPERTLDDALFKNDWFAQLDKHNYQKIYFFENEPININAVYKSCPEVEIIFIESTHARKEEVTAPIPRIKHYVRESC